MAIQAWYFLHKKTEISLKMRLPFHEEMRTLIQMVLNLFIRTLALNVALYFGSSFAAKYGNESIAAYTIAINIWFFFAFVIDGYSSAGNILSGKLLGAQKYLELKKLAYKLLTTGVIGGMILAFLSFLFYREIGGMFIKEKSVLLKFYSIFWIVLILQPVNSVAFIFDGIFKGLGYMKYLRNVLLTATFLGFVPVLLLTDYLDLQLTGIWIAFGVWIFLRGVLLVVKFYRLEYILKIA